jgi:hypothetical protein
LAHLEGKEMNFLEICQWVVAEADRDSALLTSTDVTDLTDDMHKKVVGWVKQAYGAIQREQPHWGFLFSSGIFTNLTAGWGDYPISGVRDTLDDSWRIRSAGQTTHYPLRWMEYKDWRDAYQVAYSTMGRGQPICVTRLPSGEYRFTPTPDASYTVLADWFSTSATLSVDSDTPLWDEEFHEIICWKVLAYYAEMYDVPHLAARVAMNLPAIERRFRNRYLPDVERARC